MDNPLVSVIIPTKNSEKFLEECLKSIKNQAYGNIEIIVVDNNSGDRTKEIAKKYADKVFNCGPERSAQRNFGANQSSGAYFFFVDSDMVVSSKVAESCVKKTAGNEFAKGIIIPEESYGEGFWAQCKKLERSFYSGVDWMEAARFFKKDAYRAAGGYDENMVSGEDWDLSQRIGKTGKLIRISEKIYHNEGRATLSEIVKKKFYYAKKLAVYADKRKNSGDFKKQTGIFSRYKLFLSQPKALFKNPIIGTGMLFMKTCEFAFGGLGYLQEKITKPPISGKNL